MKQLDSVVEALHLWQLDSASPGHLSDDKLCLLAEDGGLSQATSIEMTHLAKCPLCLQEWSAWRKAIAVADESVCYSEKPSEVAISHGFLQAADSGEKSPFKLKSECGRFSIDVMPQIDNPERVLMVFKVCDPHKSGYEEQVAILRDRNAEVVLRGRIHNGQFARNVDNLDQFDLTAWTVIFAKDTV